MQNLFKSVKGHVIQAISVPVAGVGSSVMISMQNDVIRICGITLSNWCVIVSFIYGILQVILAVRKHTKEESE
jgi:hypothetical protein